MMGHTMVPLNQAIGGGLGHDCSPAWGEINEAWNDPAKASQVKSNLNARRPPLEGSGNQLHGLLLYKTKGHACSVLRNVNVQVCASHNRQNASKFSSP